MRPCDQEAIVDDIVRRARVAQSRFEESSSQDLYDQAALAAAWAVMKPARNKELASLAVHTTGLGNVKDKIVKNHRKTLGLLRDIQDAKTYGIIRHSDTTGITEIARPIGVVGAVVPSTNPIATPLNNTVNALKCGNAIILSPSPKGSVACERLLGYIHAEFVKIGLDPDLVQMLPSPVSKQKAQRLMQMVDRLVVTGSQNNVQRAYASGTPALGVGAGNVAAIVDETALLEETARKIAISKTFDNATSCSSENALIVVEAVFEPFMKAIDHAGGRLLDAANSSKLKAMLFTPKGLNPDLIAKDIDAFIDRAGLQVERAESAKFLIMEGKGIGPSYPESGEKLSLAITLYKAHDFEHATKIASQILNHQGAGHSVGLHSLIDERAVALGRTLPTCRVILNQVHCYATGGAFDNGMPFSLSMGCGSWGGNSIDDNVHYKHLMNITKIIRPIEPNEPSLDSIFGKYWKQAGK